MTLTRTETAIKQDRAPRVCAALLTSIAFAQTTGSITGTIRAAARDNPAVPNAPVNSRNATTGSSYTARSAASGSFTLSGLAAGSYEVTADQRRWRVDRERGDVISGRWRGAGAGLRKLRLPRREGGTTKAVSWSPDGGFAYLAFLGRSAVFGIPLQPGQVLPRLPEGGVRSFEDVASSPGGKPFPVAGVIAAPHPSVYAYTKLTAPRNIYRLPVPQVGLDIELTVGGSRGAGEAMCWETIGLE